MLNLSRLSTAVRTTRGSRSLREAAEDAGVSFKTLQRVENEERQPDLNTLMALCDWMDMPMDYFRGDDEEPEPVPA